MEVFPPVESRDRDMIGLRTQQFVSGKQGVSFFLRVLLVIAWILGSCSLPDVPIDDEVKTQTPTVTATVVQIIPSATLQAPTQTQEVPPLTPTITPVFELEPTPTQASTIPPDGVEEVENPRFGIQAGTPAGMANITRVEDGCNWMGVGGQVLDHAGMPIVNLVVEVGGKLGEVPILELGITGSEVVFGPGGYAVKISDYPVNSDGTVWVQLFDLGGVPQTKKIYLTTYSNCDRNLILVNFRALLSSTETRVYLPAINQGK